MYQLAVENNVKVPVKFETNNGGKGKAFNFNLICTRLSQDELAKMLDDDKEHIKDVLKRVTTGWENQTLVLDAERKPVDFNEEAFEVLLSLAGIHVVIWKSLLAEVGAKTKN